MLDPPNLALRALHNVVVVRETERTTMRILLATFLILLFILALGSPDPASESFFQLAMFLLWVYGVVKCFQKNILLGIISIIFRPLVLVVGVITLVSKSGKL